jgi:hypothetical protein
MRQEAVLLGLVETVDLVDEQQRALPVPRRCRAASNTLRSSGTPVKIALIWTKCSSVSAASSRAMVVLPTPGGPQNISEESAARVQHRLSDDLGQRPGTEPVGKGARARILRCAGR